MKSTCRRNMPNADYWRIVDKQKLVWRWKWRKPKSGPLRADRSDTIGPHVHWDPNDRGSIRANERATLRPARNWQEVYEE